MSQLQIYKRPVLSHTDEENAAKLVHNAMASHGFAVIPVMLKTVLLENMRLTKEVQEHRAARGFEPLPEFKA